MSALALAYRELGGQGAPMLILHGLLGSVRNWQSAGVELAAQGYRVIAADLRNHGQSPWSEDASYEAMAADVIALIERLQCGPVHLVGHSMGGKMAMRVVMDAPTLVSRLTVVDIAPKAYPDRVRVEFEAMAKLDLQSVTTRKSADESLAGLVPEWGMRQFILTNLVKNEADQWAWGVNREALTRALPLILGNSLREGERWDGPTTFIRGGKSSYIKMEDEALIRSHFPQAQIVTLPESGHNPHFDARSGFVAAVCH
jgi:pimeloyl-ACP methyl ester carboxylesterase